MAIENINTVIDWASFGSVLRENVFSINGNAPAAAGGFFGNFTVVDEDSDITKLEEKVSWDTMRRDAVSYVYKDFGVDYFKNFIINFEIKIDNIDEDAGGHVIIVSNTIGTQQDQLDGVNGVGVWAYGSGSGSSLQFRLKEMSGSDSAQEYADGGSSSVLLYCSLMKTVDMSQCKFYSDAARTALVESINYKDGDPAVAYRYLTINNRDSTAASPSDTWSGYTQNWEIITEDYDGGAAYEDTETYTLVNGESKLTAYNTTMAFSDLDQNDAFYAYKDYGANHFSDYNIEWETEIFHATANTSQFIMLALANDIGTWETFNSANVGMAIDCWYSSSVWNFRIRDFNGDDQDIKVVLGNVVNWGPLYFKAERSGTTLTCKIYDDSDRTNLIETLSITGQTTDYRYMYTVNSRDVSAPDPIWGHNRDFKIISN